MKPTNAFHLLHLLEMASRAEDKTLNEGEPAEITCKLPQMATTVMWFRVLDKSGMNFIASFDKDGVLKRGVELPENFSDEKMKKNILILKSFKKDTDSGAYGCSAVVNSGLQFGQTTRLRGGEFSFKSLISS